MSPSHWIALASGLDAGALMLAALGANALPVWLGVWALHLAASALAGWAAWTLLPAHLRSPRAAVWGLLAALAFIVPVLGAGGALWLARWSLLRPGQGTRAVPVLVGLPTYDVQTRTLARSGQGAIRSRLGKDTSDALRMQSLLTLQAVPRRLGNPILEDLLADDTDDVRLVAFGMLDAQEKSLSSAIQTEQARLTQRQTAAQRHASLRRLAELHWELVYSSLAQGELRTHLLHQALDFANQALDSASTSPAGLFMLRARVHLALQAPQQAQDDLEIALATGLAPASVLPYMAELAYQRKDFAQVSALLVPLSQVALSAATRALVRLWTRQAAPAYDRRFLPHL